MGVIIGSAIFALLRLAFCIIRLFLGLAGWFLRMT
jgi:hypothetical protein